MMSSLWAAVDIEALQLGPSGWYAICGVWISVVLSLWALKLVCDQRPKKSGKKRAPPPLTRSESSLIDFHDCQTPSSIWGKYKYCGLRPNPTGSSEQPNLSVTELDLPLPELDTEEANKLELLQGKLADLKAAGQRTDKGTVVRYLRAEKGKVDKAEKMFRKFVAWKKKNDVDRALTHWNLTAYQFCLGQWWPSGGFLAGFGHNGAVIAWERLGVCKFASFCSRLSFEDLQKIDIIHCCRALGALEENAMRTRAPLGEPGVIMVVDVQGFSWDEVQFHAIRKLGKLIEGRELIMAETTSHVLLVNASDIVVRAWSMLGYLIPKATAEKIQIAKKKDSLALLRKYMSDDLIPAYFGGKYSHDGDPECRKILAPGGQPPDEAFCRFEKLVSEGADDPAAYLAAAGRRRSRSGSKDISGVHEGKEEEKGQSAYCTCPRRDSSADNRRSCC